MQIASTFAALVIDKIIRFFYYIFDYFIDTLLFEISFQISFL